MDGIHDLGGIEGFGPVRWQADQDGEAFHGEWQARAAAMCIYTFGVWKREQSGCSLDWFRHVRERMDPIDYLARPYFDQWTQTLMAIMIDDGIASLEEFTAAPSGRLPAAKDRPEVAPAKWQARSYSGDGPGNTPENSETKPAFAPGDRVRAKSSAGARHTRLPAFVRGRTGVVEEHHGAQIFADANARGDHRREHLYTVGFAAADLWPEVENPRDRVFVDLWESHFEPA